MKLCVMTNEVTIKQMSVGKFQILSSRRLLANLKYYQALLGNRKYYQADDVTSHKQLENLERLYFAVPCFE